MHKISSLFFVIICCTVFGQQRIVLEANCTFDNAYGTVSYYKLFKRNWLVHSGVSFGSYSYNWVYRTGEDVLNEVPLRTPYLNMNTSPDPNYYLTAYQSRNNGYALEVGIGRFWKLYGSNSIRMNLTLKGYYLREYLFGFYIQDVLSNATKYKSYEQDHQSLSIGYECFHALQITEYVTVFYGIKFPFFLPLKTRHYQPVGRKDALIGFEPNLAVGVSFGINKRLIKYLRRW